MIKAWVNLYANTDKLWGDIFRFAERLAYSMHSTNVQYRRSYFWLLHWIWMLSVFSFCAAVSSQMIYRFAERFYIRYADPIRIEGKCKINSNRD